MLRESAAKTVDEIRFIETNGAKLSLEYIRKQTLGILGKPQIVTTQICRGDTRYYVTMSGITFNIGKNPEQADKWRSYPACNSGNSATALVNYFLHLRDACAIKRGNQNFRWDGEKLQFVELK